MSAWVSFRTVLLCALAVGLLPGAPRTAAIAVEYPLQGSVFPPEFPPPTFLFRDESGADAWVVEILLAGSARPVLSRNLSQAGRWTPDREIWETIKKVSTSAAAIIKFTGYRKKQPISSGQVRIFTSSDPVGAPIFYREVPLLPSETEKGVIKPLDQSAVRLIRWRLRDVSQTESRIVMEGLHTCANCHSFSRDGKTMGLDVDGPQNDKGLYAILPVQPSMSIRNEDVVAWSTFRGKLGGRQRVGFMSQVSPDGQTVITTINDPGVDETEYQRRKSMKEVALNYYVANFKDYRFLQVFFPTRGVLAWYSKASGRLNPLPGADDPKYVHTNAVWSPDGEYLVFARAAAMDPYAVGAPVAVRANDPNETQIRYDLYRIPFRDGRGGQPVPIAGASGNGKSNSFPKVSPDGRWIVYVQSRNGLLMRPDSELYVVPASGGTARRMNCNTKLMNSWHSFSPNGRWIVFSSKSRSPYTQMFLTHFDENGNDSPPILIEGATDANRAVNIPEFVNIPPDGMLKIDAPATEYYRVVDLASDLMKKNQFEAAAAEWKKAIELNPAEAKPYNNLGMSLARTGKEPDAIPQFEKALELSPEYPEAHNNLGVALVGQKKVAEAIVHFEKAIDLNRSYGSAYGSLGSALIQQGRVSDAIPALRKAIELNPGGIESYYNLAIALAKLGRMPEAAEVLRQVGEISKGQAAPVQK